MSILAEWGDGTRNLIFYVAILLTGLAFEIMGFRLVASGFRAPKSTVLFQWGENKFRLTQVVPGVAIAFIGGGLVIAGFHLIHPHENASDIRDILEQDIWEVECTYMVAGNVSADGWVLTVYGNRHGLLHVDEGLDERSVLFMMPTRSDLIGPLVRCGVRHLPSELGQGYEHEELRRIKIRTSTFEKTIWIHAKVDESEEHARCVMGAWRIAARIAEEAQKLPQPQEPGKIQNTKKGP